MIMNAPRVKNILSCNRRLANMKALKESVQNVVVNYSETGLLEQSFLNLKYPTTLRVEYFQKNSGKKAHGHRIDTKKQRK